MSSLTILSDIQHDRSWAPVLHMQNLLASLTGAEIHHVAPSSNRLQSFLNRRRPGFRSKEPGVALCITPKGTNIPSFVTALRKLGGFSRVAMWIIDSFWTDWVLHERSLIDRHFDDILYMQSFDTDFYRKLFGDRSLCLGWGSDALNLGGAEVTRNHDLLRVGRQPPGWDDDAETERACVARGLSFEGRPPTPTGPVLETLMRNHYSRAKFVVAHSNIAAPAPYTHPTKAYITGRWTDALACGTVVAGVPPVGDTNLIDWPESLLVLPTIDRDAGLDQIAAAAAEWTPEVARQNYLGALRKLDWRWRFRSVVNHLEIEVPALNKELGRLEDRIAAVGASRDSTSPGARS